MKSLNNKRIVGIILLFFILSLNYAAVKAETDEYVPPEVSIVMMTDISETPVNTIKMSGDGKYIVADTFDSVMLYAVPDSFDGETELIWNLTGHENAWRQQISNDGTKVTFYDNDENKYYCYSNVGTDDTWAFDIGTDTFSTAIMSPDGSTIFLLLWDSLNFEYDFVGLNGTTGTEIWRTEDTYFSSQLSFNNNGSTIAVGLINGTMRCFNGYTGDFLWEGQCGATSVKSVAMSNDGSTIVSSSYDSSPDNDNISVWDVSTGDLLWTSIIEAADRGLSISGTGDKIIVGSYTVGATDKKVRCYERDAKNLLWEASTTVQTRITDTSVNGKITAAGIYDGIVLIVDADAGETIMQHNTYSPQISYVTVSIDGTTVAATTDDGMLIVYKIALDESNSGSGNILGDLTDALKNLDTSNYILMGGSALVGLILGGLIFGLAKKKK